MRNKESLKDAVAGSYAVFGVTNYWENLDAEDEKQQGKNLVDAVKDAGVQHFIWSSLPYVSKISGGKLTNVYHFDSKAQVAEYALEAGVPVTFFMPGYFMTNLPGGMFRNSGPNGEWVFSMPTPSSLQIPLFYPPDTGKYVKAAVLNRDKTLGKKILGATTYLTGDEIVEAFKKVYPEAGKTAKFYEVPEQDFKDSLVKMGNPEFVATELLENMKLMYDFGYYGGESLDWTHSLCEDHLTTWEELLKTSEAFKGLN
jgi:uncharacterized protein YbjT (DUF2867 family)